MFLPTIKSELTRLGWNKLDIILVTGDTYIDSSYNGAAVIGKVLLDAGYKVGIIAQPDYKSGKDITRLGEPELFWGVTSGCVDSMVSNYTATKKRGKTIKSVLPLFFVFLLFHRMQPRNPRRCFARFRSRLHFGNAVADNYVFRPDGGYHNVSGTILRSCFWRIYHQHLGKYPGGSWVRCYML